MVLPSDLRDTRGRASCGALEISCPLCDGGDVYFDIEGTRKAAGASLAPARRSPARYWLCSTWGLFTCTGVAYNGRFFPVILIRNDARRSLCGGVTASRTSRRRILLIRGLPGAASARIASVSASHPGRFRPRRRNQIEASSAARLVSSIISAIAARLSARPACESIRSIAKARLTCLQDAGLVPAEGRCPHR